MLDRLRVKHDWAGHSASFRRHWLGLEVGLVLRLALLGSRAVLLALAVCVVGDLGDVVDDVDIIINGLSVFCAIASRLIAVPVVCRARKRVPMRLASRASGAPCPYVLTCKRVDLRFAGVPCAALLVVEATSPGLIRMAARVRD